MSEQFRYFEDYQVDQKGATTSGLGTRTVTETDIVNFACLTATYAREHMDQHYATNSIHGKRIAAGIMGCSLAMGMLSLKAPHILGHPVPGYEEPISIVAKRTIEGPLSWVIRLTFSGVWLRKSVTQLMKALV